MCCIFTCCGWMIDLIQRFWVFLMSCCISSAVCCVLITASLAGIALGYNYSLAEYIDLRQTNVSVYLKRGIFDDEMQDEGSMRRSGAAPAAAAAQMKDSDSIITEDSEQIPLGSRRRLDNSILDTDNKYKYEGSLMKLTAKPLDLTTNTADTEDLHQKAITSKFPYESLDAMKAMKSLDNMRRFLRVSTTTVGQSTASTLYSPYEIKQGPQPHFPYGMVVPEGRRTMPEDHRNFMNPARFAVPSQEIGRSENWGNPLLPPNWFTRDFYSDGFPMGTPTMPKPIHLNVAPCSPKPLPPLRTVPPFTEASETPDEKAIDGLALDLPFRRKNVPSDEEINKMKNNILFNEIDLPGFKSDEDMKLPAVGKSDEEDYDVAQGGVPVRKRRDGYRQWRTQDIDSGVVRKVSGFPCANKES